MRKALAIATLALTLGATAAEARRATGSVTRNTVITRADGKTARETLTRNWDRTAGTYQANRTQTGFNGRTRTVDTSVRRTAPGRYEGSRTVTRPDGTTRTTTASRTVTHGN